jgi:hypothetical protein
MKQKEFPVPCKRTVCTMAAVLLLLSPVAVWSAAGARVEFSSGRISITAEDATLASIAEQFSRVVGVRVYLDRSEQARIVSMRVQDASFDKALKTLSYPLNFAIVSDVNGTVTELRIFGHAGLKEGDYRIFSDTKPLEAKLSQFPGRQAAASTTGGSTASAEAISAKASAGPESAPAGLLAGASRLLTGERALQTSVWLSKQIMEAEQVRQNMQVKADQADVRSKEREAALNAPAQSYPGPQKEPTAIPQTGAGVLASEQNQQAASMAYQQHASQQSGFSSSIYYQQWMLRESLRRGQQ